MQAWLRPDLQPHREALLERLPGTSPSVAHVELLPHVSADRIQVPMDRWLRFGAVRRRVALLHRARALGLSAPPPLGWVRDGVHGWLLRPPRQGLPLHHALESVDRTGRTFILRSVAWALRPAEILGLAHPQPHRGLWWDGEAIRVEDFPGWERHRNPGARTAERLRDLGFLSRLETARLAHRSHSGLR